MAGAAVGFFIAGPPGALIGGGIAPLTRFAIRRGIGGVQRAQQRRREDVLHVAARAAGLSSVDLLARLRATPQTEDLLLQTLRAAADSAMTAKLVALAAALAHVAVRPETQTIAFETIFVRALSDCAAPHVLLLELFTKTGNELGLGDGGSDFDQALDALNERQIGLAQPDLLPMLVPLLAVLQRHGLVVPRNGAGPTPFAGGPAPFTSWSITAVGRTFLERLRLVHTVTRPWGS